MVKHIVLWLVLTASAFGSVSDGESIREYFTLGAGTTEFVFTQPCESADDILVYKRYIETDSETEGLQTLLTESVDYTIASTGGDYANGGTVTISPALGVNYEVVIVRKTKQSQEVTSGAVTPTSLIEIVDRLERQVQDLQDRLDRALHLQEADGESFNMVIPGLASRAGTYLYFNADGEPTYVASVAETSSSSSITTTPFSESLLDDSSALIARGTLGIDTDDDVEFAAITGTTATFSGAAAITGDVTLSGDLTMQAAKTVLVHKVKAIDATGIILIDASGDTILTIEDAGTVAIDGDTTIDATLDMNTNVITGLDDGDADTEAIHFGQFKADNTAAATFGAGSQSCTLPNGMVIKSGYTAIGATTGTITFDDAFPNGVTGLSTTMKYTTNTLNTLVVTDYTVFDIDWAVGDSAMTGFYWMAIGY